MIERTVKQIGGYMDSPYVGAYLMTEEGDTLIVKPSTPILGLTNILSVPVLREEHEFPNGYFDVSFRYSLDEGLNWSESYSLSRMPGVPTGFKKNHYFSLEFSITKKGPGQSWFMGIDFEDSLSYALPSIPDFYKQQNPLPSLPYYNHESIQWALNVLEKVYRRGIVPSFIPRGSNENWEDEDYINLWWSFLYPIALRISYTEGFSDLLWNPDLLKEYLEQKGIIVGNSSHLGELFHMMSNFYDEETRRGTFSVFDKERPVQDGVLLRGEALRLIDYQNPTDLFLGLLNYYEQGWWLGQTSVCGYINTDNYSNFRIAYENGFHSLSAYPLTENHSVISIEDGEMIVTSSAAGFSGIGSNDLTKAVPIVTSREYLVEVKFTLPTSQRVKFRVDGYDELDNHVDFLSRDSQEGGIGIWRIENDFIVQSHYDSNNFVSFDSDYFTLPAGTYTLLGIIKKAGSVFTPSPDGLTFNLEFRQNTSMAKIMPVFQVYGSATIHDFRVSYLMRQETYLESILKKSGIILIKNNNFEYTNLEIERILTSRLLPSEVDARIIFE